LSLSPAVPRHRPTSLQAVFATEWPLRSFTGVSPESLWRLPPCDGCFHLETAAKLLKLLKRVPAVFSKCGLKLFDNQADFDSAIPRFESGPPSQCNPSVRKGRLK